MIDTKLGKASFAKLLKFNKDEQKHLATQQNIGIRCWENEPPTELMVVEAREYKTAGYVIGGKADLYLQGQLIKLNAGDTWVVPKGVSYSYKITEAWRAIKTVSSRG